MEEKLYCVILFIYYLYFFLNNISNLSGFLASVAEWCGPIYPHSYKCNFFFKINHSGDPTSETQEMR